MSFIARTFPYFFRKGFLPFLKKQKYHTQPPAMATTIMPPMTHQTTGLPVLLSCSASEDVLLTLLPGRRQILPGQGLRRNCLCWKNLRKAHHCWMVSRWRTFPKRKGSQSLVPGWKRAPVPMGSGWRSLRLLGGCLAAGYEKQKGYCKEALL